MSGQWKGSDRKSRLPADWAERRRKVAARAGGQCEAKSRSGERCWRRGTDCDHIQAGDDHSLSNLQWLCPKHHLAKSSAEGVAARVKAPRSRPAERHPGQRRSPGGGA